jgi:hypothetical protein
LNENGLNKRVRTSGERRPRRLEFAGFEPSSSNPPSDEILQAQTTSPATAVHNLSGMNHLPGRQPRSFFAHIRGGPQSRESTIVGEFQ